MKNQEVKYWLVREPESNFLLKPLIHIDFVFLKFNMDPNMDPKIFCSSVRYRFSKKT
jgi:hypothetical protein